MSLPEKLNSVARACVLRRTMDFNEHWIITGERLQSLADITMITPEVEQFHSSLPSVKTNLVVLGS